MLEYPQGPVLQDYPHDAKKAGDEAAPMACPINFTTQPAQLTNIDKLLQSFTSEVSVIRTWYDIAREKAGRSTAGVSELSLEEIATLYIDFIAGDIDKIELHGKKLSDLLRMATEDLKACYLEAVTAQPGQPTDVQTLSNWFWGETFAASVVNEVRKNCLNDDAKDMILAGKLLLIPRNQMHRF